MKNLYLRLTLKSFHFYYLNKFVAIMLKKKLLFFPTLQKHVFLPKRIQKFTVLSSPHVDKKSRDQFEQRKYKRVLYWNLSYFGENKKALLIFLRNFRFLISLAVGIEFQITYDILNNNKLKTKKRI